jgi:hypothetical protein
MVIGQTVYIHLYRTSTDSRGFHYFVLNIRTDKITQIKKMHEIEFAGHMQLVRNNGRSTDSPMTIIDVTLYLEFGKFQLIGDGQGRIKTLGCPKQ